MRRQCPGQDQDELHSSMHRRQHPVTMVLLQQRLQAAGLAVAQGQKGAPKLEHALAKMVNKRAKLQWQWRTQRKSCR